MTKTLTRAAFATVLLAAMLTLYLYRDSIDTDALIGAVDRAGIWAPLLFMLMYAMATVLLIPGSILTLAGGALFGPLWGTLYNLLGATCGAALAFLAARYLAADWVNRRTGGWLQRVIDGVGKEGWRFVAFVRLVPLFPFNLVNYALGVTRIPFAQYALTTLIAMLPGAFVYTYVGYAGREALGGGENVLQKGLLALGLLAAVAFLPSFIKRLRQAPVAMIDLPTLQQRLRDEPDLLILDVRSEQEYRGKMGHIPNARLLPLPELPAALHTLDRDPSLPVVIICRTDIRSAQAARLMNEAGWPQVSVLTGGMLAWQRAGLPVSRD
jgi:uncharacterized membrane protein YdjX (TVP38/TMEM64 family)/rhodanese-related sulfurtransferase